MPNAELEATITMTTYYNYVTAWVVALEREYGVGQAGIQAFCGCQQELDTFKRLQGGGHACTDMASALFRGKLTLTAMQKLPVDSFPDLAPTANLWLPVQAYFVAHGMGMAVLSAMGKEVPKDHRRFRATFSENISRLLPFPFCARCKGGPLTQHFTFLGIDTSAASVASQNNLANPRNAQGHHFLGKSLSTTRDKALEEVFDKARREHVKPNRSRRNLKPDERERLTKRLHTTSIADLLYRMRVRANYDDPEMYLAAFNNAEGAIAHYRALTYLSVVLAEGLCAIVRHRIGSRVMNELEARLQ